MPEIVFPENTRVASLSGHVVNFIANKPQDVIPIVYDAALKQGGRPTGGSEPVIEPVAVEEEPLLSQLTKAIDSIFASGDLSKLTKDKSRPRVGALRKLVTVDFTDTDVDMALTEYLMLSMDSKQVEHE